ncbi:MAG: carboxylate--amine ligase [Lactobacillus sp.]|uniref:carboxylate--amine ligase n=1 Tax=Bombilactobacillus bombi TaxID=1303590 RepID=UPI0015FCAE08|nr:carboxylate--amine ligase [Bombilactobacillus bombi]MCO6540813.1 carboxylate--amine ligase [Lactobacillus sp.]MCO6542461.1 carboxylate--amine ligase [Lactobacillus sp.]
MDNQKVPQFTPILLGSDINAYGFARSFYELTHQPVQAYAEMPLAPTKYSRIINVSLHDGFAEDPTFIETMRSIAQKYANHPEPVILLAMGDGYAELIAKHKEELSQTFICPYVDYELLRRLNNKESFYQICNEYHLPHPQTKIITRKMYQEQTNLTVPFDYPVALKPANSVEWLDIHFEGRKKAFTIHSQAEFLDIVGKIYDHGYKSDLILQEFIPGDDSHMRVLNAYVDQNHHVKMLCLGHPLLEDPTPASIGNYVAILPEYDQKLYDLIQKFLEDIEFTGFANFDMKYDDRDHEFKLFEINLRQGRSSFFVTLNGYNLAKYVIDDYVTGTLEAQSTVYGNKNKAQHQLWLGVPVHVFKKYALENQYKEVALELLRQDRYGTTVFFKGDLGFKRFLLMSYMFYRYRGRFKRYFEENKGQDFK